MNQLDQFTQFRRPRGLLARIPEHHVIPSVPDIRLECDEIIENWDEIDSCNTSIYSPEHKDKLAVTSQYAFSDSDVLDLYSSDLPSNSPANEIFQEVSPLLSQNRYVDSLLQIWREACDSTGSSAESTQATASDTDGFGSQNDSLYGNSTDGSQSTECFVAETNQEIIREQINSFVSSEFTDFSENNITTTGSGNQSFMDSSSVHEEISLLSLVENLRPLSQSSSRSTSPAEIENISQSVLRLSFDNLRSISPRIERSPSPISSRSSSPRFLRSPSPFQVLNNTYNSQMEDSTDALVFYDDRYIFRSVSPRLNRSYDHMVPDIGTEYLLDISVSEELFGNGVHTHSRVQSSCQDQVVPEYIEE